jgi:3-phenylpropionate/cinnamic acid dioxygenase small subunit
MQPTRGSVDRDTAQAIADFHALETDLLNNRQLAEWLDLVTDDFTYIVPTPETPDTPAKKPWSERARIVDEDKWSLEHLWALRWRSEVFEFAWGENPPQRTRRFVTGLRVLPTSTPGEYETTSNVLLSFVRQADPAVLAPARRVDLVREVDGAFKLARRVVLLDQTIIGHTHMRLVF